MYTFRQKYVEHFQNGTFLQENRGLEKNLKKLIQKCIP